jgi:hypothetical protein
MEADLGGLARSHAAAPAMAKRVLAEAPLPGRILSQCEGRARRAVDLRPMVALDDLDVPRGREAVERGPHRRAEGQNAQAEVGGTQHRRPFRHLVEQRVVVLAEAGRPGDERQRPGATHLGRGAEALGRAEIDDDVAVAHDVAESPRGARAVG